MRPNIPNWKILSGFRIRFNRPHSALVDQVDQAEKETAASVGAVCVDDFRLRGSSTRRHMGVHLADGGTSKVDMISTTPTLFSQRAEPPPLWSQVSPKHLIRRGATRISTVGCGNATRGYASRVPVDCLVEYYKDLIINGLRSTGQYSTPHSIHRDERDSFGPSRPSRDGWPGSNCDHRTAERADNSGFPTVGGNRRSLRKEPVQQRVQECSGMPGTWRSQPARQSSRIQRADTVERHGGFDVVMEKIAQWEQENPTSTAAK